MLHSICQQIWKTQQWPQDWKRSVLTPIPRKDSTKESSNHRTTVLISQASKVMLKILYSRLQHYMNWELPDVQAGFRKGRGTRDQIANIHSIIEKVRKFQKNICLYFTDYAKAFDCVDHDKLWKFLKRQEYQTILPVSWETCMQVKKQELETCMEQLSGSGLRKEYDKVVYCHPVYLTYMQSTSCDLLGWMSYKLKSRLPGEISTTSDMWIIPPLWQKVKRN